MALKMSGEASPKRGALPDALLRLRHHDPPVYIPDLQEETILAVSIYTPICQYIMNNVVLTDYARDIHSA